MILPGMTLTRGGAFEVWPCWMIPWPDGGCPLYVPDLHYRRDRIGD